MMTTSYPAPQRPTGKSGVDVAEAFSRDQIGRLRSLLAEPDISERINRWNIGLAVAGSTGRLEALEASDIDLVTLCPESVNPVEVLEFDREIRNVIRARLNIEVSQGENFTGPTRVSEIASVAVIGGYEDRVAFLTKRVAFLADTRPVFNDALHLSFREEILRAFLSSPATRRRYLIPLIDEIVRYYRTLCIDYKNRVDAYNKPWALRYFKLRCSRKYWFFSLMIGLTALLVRCEPLDDDMEAALPEVLDASPTARLRSAVRAAGLDGHPALFSYYSRYLDCMSSPSAREELGEIKYEERYRDALFVSIKQNADRLHRAMLELIESLPAAWRRHLFSRFLLHS